MFTAHPAAAAAKSLQSCPTLCDPRDGSPSGSPVPGILQARTPEWVAISFSNAWKWKVKGKSLSRVRLLVSPWTAADQASLSMWSRQEWVAISFSNAWKWKVKGKSLSRVRLLVSPWTAADQASPSMWSRQEYWSGVPSPHILPNLDELLCQIELCFLFSCLILLVRQFLNAVTSLFIFLHGKIYFLLWFLFLNFIIITLSQLH